jgi:penicillin G amidase
MDQITVEDMMTLQNDNFHLHAAEILPTMLAWVKGEHLDEEGRLMLEELKDWDFFTDPDQKAPSLFDSWWKHIEYRLRECWNVRGVPVAFPERYRLSQLMREAPEGAWFDDRNTGNTKETASDLVKAAFHRMVKEIKSFEEDQGDYTWRSYKNTRVSHLVPNFRAFSYEKLDIGGGKGIINAASGNWGPGWRMVVEPGIEGTAYGIYPGGQSGNPGSRFYDSFLRMWERGEYVDISLKKGKEEVDSLLYQLHFNPEDR